MKVYYMFFQLLFENEIKINIKKQSEKWFKIKWTC